MSVTTEARRRIAFVCSRFGGGGAEKHLLRILNAADHRRYDVHLILTRDGGNYEQFLRDDITVHHLSRGIGSSTLALALGYGKLSGLVAKITPDLVVSFMDRQNVMVARALGNGKIPFVLCCQNMPSKSLADGGWMGRWHLRQLAKLYPRCARLICISRGVQRDVRRLTGMPDHKTPVVYNAGYDEAIHTLQFEGEEQPKNTNFRMVACGRLTTQKGFDLLLRALAQVPGITEMRLDILGTGPDEDALKELRDDLGLSQVVNFLGFQSNPYPFFRRADLFVLSSRWEGFGNVITEAMACGTPVLSTNCPAGPDEIITHGHSGWLVETENVAAIAEGIRTLASDPELRAKLGRNGSVRSADFSPATISRQYFDQFDQIISGEQGS
ncbi:glycosyltransferase [Lewinella sp. W8]|uniref:glycosyltransferase n=1 Tax=Lewinella sp. W8 TaxID=2528208 RepID=UPI001068355D|nr:glycosyltransferase [Lewinella sp. W8]MTB53174.1 glycosyltransferase [Lewinella sp. W8]